jgi:nucleoside-diphosphate-sugar epimerase
VEILITGGGGLLGRHLVPALLDRGDRVRVLALPDENVSWLEEYGVTVYRGDICQQETLAQPMEGAEGVLHLAAMMGAWRPLQDYRSVNVIGTENVCRVALERGIHRFVHISSWTVYGMGLPMPCHEDFRLEPFSEPYAITKAEGDKLVQRMIAEEGLPAVIIRPGTFFGPGDRLHFGRIADRVRSRRAIIVGRGDNALPFVYVTDVVQGLLLALVHERAVGQAFNITNDMPLTQQELLQAIAQEIDVKPPRLHIPYGALYAPAYAAEYLATTMRSRRQPPLTRLGVKLFGTNNRHAIDKARRELGYSPRVALHEGVRLAASWYLKENPQTGARVE